MSGSKHRLMQRPEMCSVCGFLMNAVLGADDQPPVDDDVACCGGCGYPFRRCGAAWLPLTLLDLAAMQPDDLARLVIFRAQIRALSAKHRGAQPRPTLQ
jgi:hypothetical protein